MKHWKRTLEKHWCKHNL